MVNIVFCLSLTILWCRHLRGGREEDNADTPVYIVCIGVGDDTSFENFLIYQNVCMYLPMVAVHLPSFSHNLHHLTGLVLRNLYL